MHVRAPFTSRISVWRLAGVASVLTFCSTPLATRAQPSVAGDVTFAKDIVTILQRACQRCHNPNGVAPMSLVTYDEARPWAKAMKERTSRGPRAGVMPPWFVERDIGIQNFKDDPSLTE